MPTSNLRQIRAFPELVRYLEEQLDWPLNEYGFDELTFEYTPGELGLKEEDAARIKAIHQLRPLANSQPWGIFFVEFENKKLPVVVLRRILSHLALKKRASANKASAPAWHADDLLFITAFGEDGTDAREIAFAHFHQNPGDMPTLHVLGWDGGDTPLKLANVDHVLRERLHWPADVKDTQAWRETWSKPFRHRIGHVITTASLLAEELASLARGIRDKAKLLLNAESEKGEITKLFKAFQTALIHDLTPESFADTYAQTITYGLLTAAISRTDTSEGRYGTFVKADDIADMVPITNPFLKEMLQTFLKVGGRKGGIDFDELGIQDVVELLRGDETDLPAILRDFGNKTRGEDPVIHFYEHFLSAYNKKLKIQRGVFYTPQPVVSYIVRSVHELLQTEFGLEDGLASIVTWGEMLKKNPELKLPPLTDSTDEKRTISPDEPFVVILDPATGTATFLVEVINVIHRILTEKWTKQGKNQAQRLEAWNDYVPAHLLPRLYGYELMMAPYAIAHMKTGLKLAETGYRFGSEERVRVYLTNALESAHEVQPQLEALAPALAHEAQAVARVKRGVRFTVLVGNPPYSIMSANLDAESRMLVDRFRSIENKRIVEKSAIVLERTLQDDYVKFYALADRLICSSQVGLVGLISNSSFLENINLRGMRWRMLSIYQHIHILDLHGDADRKESTKEGEKDENVFDIKKGVSILVALKHADMLVARKGVFRLDILGSRGYKYGQLVVADPIGTSFEKLIPRSERFSFLITDTAIVDEFEHGISVEKIFIKSATGIETGKDSILVAFDQEELRQRLTHFGDPSLHDSDIRKEFDAEEGCGRSISDLRKSIPTDVDFESRLQPFTFSPFDTRWVFYRKDVINVHSYLVVKHLLDGKNIVLLVMRQVVLNKGFSHIFVTRMITNNRAFYSTRGKAYMFPLWLNQDENELNLHSSGISKNTADLSVRKLCSWAGRSYQRELLPSEVLAFVYGCAYSVSYRVRYDSPLRSDYPHIPIPASASLFDQIAKLGDELVALHLLESPKLDQPITEFIGGKNPEVEKVSWSGNTVWVDKAQSIGFKGVREDVWNFHIGGYQVCQKWLKDRKGRTLSKDDIVHYQKIVIALSETIRLMAEIDQVIETYGGWPDAFASAAGQDANAALDGAR